MIPSKNFLEVASNVSRKSSQINSRFPNLSLLDGDARALSKAQGVICDMAKYIHQKGLALDKDELTYYLLHAAISSIDKKKDLALAETFHPRETEQVLRLHLAQSFHRQYKGDAPLRLLLFAMTVNQALFLNKPQGECPYYRGTTIVQSSSTSKLRMLLQLGRSVLLLYMCICPQIKALASSGYPLGNNPIIKVALTHFSEQDRSTNLKAAVIGGSRLSRP